MTRSRSLSCLIAAATFAVSASGAFAQTTQPATTRPALARATTRPVRPKPVATLHVGDHAPALVVEKWLKGTPVTSLTDGKVHVVELWATWCGPCKAGMPHVSALAKKYADKVVITGVDVWEHTTPTEGPTQVAAKVEKFVGRAGDMMAYNVAMDGQAAKVEKDWATAAAIPGIPSAFVVDATGTIAWIGHPMMGMEEAIDLVLAGRPAKEVQPAVDAVWSDERKKQGTQGLVLSMSLMKDGKYADALTAADHALADAPFMAPMIVGIKYACLTHTDPAAAAKFGDQLLADDANAPLLLIQVSGSVMGNGLAKPAGTPDYKLARRMLEQSTVCLEPDWSTKRQLADACFHTDDLQKAVELQTEVVAEMKAIPHTPATFQKTIDGAQEKLDTYKKAAEAKHVG